MTNDADKQLGEERLGCWSGGKERLVVGGASLPNHIHLFNSCSMKKSLLWLQVAMEQQVIRRNRRGA